MAHEMTQNAGQGLMSMFAHQWRMTRIQLVNWGTFCGYHDFPLEAFGESDEPPVVMITGESGTGKSTLFDAKTAVLQKHNVPFNVASNAQQKGRARSGNQRNLYTYVLGKQDDVFDEGTGEEREVRLRPTTTPQWAAVVLTFQDTQGAVFSAARFYYVPAQGQESDLRQFMVTAHDELDPRSLESHLSQSVNKKLLLEVYPKAEVHDTASGFLSTVYGHMEIGPDADGDNAMKLHQRIQGGYPITDVDALFKELVIDEPTTYSFARRALDAFAESENVWTQMDEVRQKLQELEGIRASYANYEESRERFALLESLLDQDGGPFDLWLARRHAEVLGEAVQQLVGRQADLESRERELADMLEERKAEHEQLAEEVRGKGGDAIDRRRAQLATARVEEQARSDERERMRSVLEAAGRGLPSDAEAFAALQAESAHFIADYDNRVRELDERRLAHEVAVRDLRMSVDEVGQQLEYYRAHPVNITPEMAEARDAMARALGVEADELPYGAELIDMKKSEERWRLAVCVGYHGLAMQVLVDERRLDDLSVAIDKLKLGRRVNFRGIDLSRSYQASPREGWLSSKVVVKDDSPFAEWMRCELCREAYDHECVEGPEDLAGDHAKIDTEGQTRNKKRGAHGYSRRGTYIIGFTNKALVRELEAELDGAVSKLSVESEEIAALGDQFKLLTVRRDAANWMTQHAFDQVNVEGSHARVRVLEEEIARLEADDMLKALVARRDAVASDVEHLQMQRGAVQRDRAGCEEARHEFESEADAVWKRVSGIETAGVVTTEAQAACVAESAQRHEEALLGGEGDDWQALATGYGGVEDRVRRDLAQAKSQVQRVNTMAKDALESVFRGYHDRWLGEDDPTGTLVASYPDYLRILEELEADRLNEPRDQWLKSLFVQTATTLVPLSDAFGKDLREIHNRMRPINGIMEKFDFGPDHGRLRIAVRDRERAEITRFRRELQRWSALATRVEEVELDEATHRELRGFMGMLDSELSRGVRGVLNTKRLVTITVMARYPDEASRPDNTYSSLDAKSGGETQELIAFILGAALLFCLGQNAEGLPSFSPVFLDEAFVKADEHFTQRAIGALSGLGFQVIIAVPTSKVQAVEPVAAQYVCITKNREGHSFINPMQRSAGEPKRPDAASGGEAADGAAAVSAVGDERAGGEVLGADPGVGESEGGLGDDA